MAEEGALGAVGLLRRYPVKSLLGENLRACDVTRRGRPATRCTWGNRAAGLRFAISAP
jgi:hypothetical protein